MRNRFVMFCLAAAIVSASGCKKSSPSAPTPPVNTNPPVLTAPTLTSPTADQQLDVLRPTLTVQNGTSDQPTGTRTYEFQISDRSDFSLTASSNFGSYAVVVNRTGVAEGTGGSTTYTVETDLQPTTRLYWRVRMVQSSVTSAWSASRSFKTRLVGFIRAGELYDPLIHGETVGQRVGATEFLPGRGIRLIDEPSHVRYLLPATISTGEFSMDVEGLRPNMPGGKYKVFSMREGQAEYLTNRFRIDAQYRGLTGAPANCIQWRASFGGDHAKIEPTTSERHASVRILAPERTYHWRGTIQDGFRLEVLDGGIGGSALYNKFIDENDLYNPQPHNAYLGAPLGTAFVESASIPGAIYRNVWLGNRARPASLGSALIPLR